MVYDSLNYFFTQYHSFRFLQIIIQLIINIYKSEYISISLVIQSEINIWFFFICYTILNLL